MTVEIVPEELGFPIEIGDIAISECQMISQFKGSASEPPQFTRGYGLAFGYCERKAMAMALIDRSLRCANWARNPPTRPRTRNSCSITATASRPPGSCNT